MQASDVPDEIRPVIVGLNRLIRNAGVATGMTRKEVIALLVDLLVVEIMPGQATYSLRTVGHPDESAALDDEDGT